MRVSVAALLALAALAADSASAQSDTVARGVARYAEADFEGAITLLEQALSGEELTLDEAELALDRLATSQLAVGDAGGLERTLARLALIAPEHEFGADVPAELAQRLAAARARVSAVRVRIREAPLPDGRVELRAAAANDPWRAVRTIEVLCRSGENARGARPVVVVSQEDRCEASVHGPGGVDLARGAWEGAGAAAGGGVDPLAVGLGVGGAAAAVVVIVIAVAVATSGGGGGGPVTEIELRGPIIVGW